MLKDVLPIKSDQEEPRFGVGEQAAYRRQFAEQISRLTNFRRGWHKEWPISTPACRAREKSCRLWHDYCARQITGMRVRGTLAVSVNCDASRLFTMEKEGARWHRWSSKPVWGSSWSPEGSTPSLLRHELRNRFVWLPQMVPAQNVNRLRYCGPVGRSRMSGRSESVQVRGTDVGLKQTLSSQA